MEKLSNSSFYFFKPTIINNKYIVTITYLYLHLYKNTYYTLVGGFNPSFIKKETVRQLAWLLEIPNWI